MKNYVKILVLFIVALYYSIPAGAQTQLPKPPQKFSFGLNGGIAKDRHSSYAIGGDMRFLFNISKRLSIPLTFGYTSIVHKGYVTKTGVKVTGDSHDAFPLKLGVKGFFNETGVGFYGLIEVGLVAMPGYVGFNSIPKAFSPAIGYGWENGLDLAIKYEEYARSDGYTGLRLGYWF